MGREEGGGRGRGRGGDNGLHSSPRKVISEQVKEHKFIHPQLIQNLYINFGMVNIVFG